MEGVFSELRLRFTDRPLILSEEREPQDQEAPAIVESDAPDRDPTQRTSDPNTPFAITFYCLAIAALLLWFLPTYLSPYVGRIFMVLLYIVAGLIGLFGIFAFYVGLKERPELRRFFKGVLHGLLIKPLGVFGAPREDAWISLNFAALLLAFDFALHVVIISWIGVSGIAEIIAKLVIFGLGILALIFITNVFDVF